MRHPRKTLAVATALAAFAATALLPSGQASAASGASPAYQITIGAVNSFAYPDDTPASAYLDNDGTFHFQQSYSLYAKTDPRVGVLRRHGLRHATLDAGLSNAVNPANAQDDNNDTTWRCNNSPTGRRGDATPDGSGLRAANYCDLVGTWVDPDTGDWYGLVHNEFTPQPFGDGLHYDAIDYAVSTDQGKTWTIQGHAITSPYSTKRGDTTAFPKQTYYYGDGDQRLFVDTASGYFYVYYGSRVVDKRDGGWRTARRTSPGPRCPARWRRARGRSGTTAPGRSRASAAGRATWCRSTPRTPTGYTPGARLQPGQPPAPPTSRWPPAPCRRSPPLFIMNIAYDAYLGLYIGEPETVDQDRHGAAAVLRHRRPGDAEVAPDRRIRAATDRVLVPVVRSTPRTSTNSTIIGKKFRSYCSIACATSDGDYATSRSARRRPEPHRRRAARGQNVTIASGNGRVLAQTAGSSQVTSLDRVLRLGAGGVDDRGDRRRFLHRGELGDRGRARGGLLEDRLAGLGYGAVRDADRRVGAERGPGVVRGAEQRLRRAAGSFRLVNRDSGLALGMAWDSSRSAETTPVRSWTDTSGSTVGGGRQPSEQTLTFTPAHPAQGPEVVHVVAPGDQSGVVGTSASVQVSGSDSKGKTLEYSATGLPAGLSINPGSGLISGTPTYPGTSPVTVTASSGHASASATFTYAVSPKPVDLSGVHTVANRAHNLAKKPCRRCRRRTVRRTAATSW